MADNLVRNEDSVLAEFSMAIAKANIKDGVMRFRSVNSDIAEDYYGEKMSRELFQDFIKHIENEDDIPEPFKSVIAEDDWDGGMPYISIAHYKTGKDKVNVPGEPEKIYLDGNALKSTGVLYDTPLGKAVFKSLSQDLVEKREDKIRVSIGFLDLEHSHGDKYTFTRKSLTDKCPLCKSGVRDKIYKKGHLVHLALTRKPANPRTDVEVEKSMTTKREDAESIIEDEEVIKGLDLKSQTDDVLVIKNETETVETPVAPVETVVEKTEVPVVPVTPVENSRVSATITNTDGETVTVNIPAVPFGQTTSGLYQVVESPVEKSIAALVNRVADLKSQGLTGDSALQELQSSVDELGNVLRAEFTPKPTPEQVANQNLEATLRSLLSEMLPQYLGQTMAQTVAPIQSELGELRALSLVRQPSNKKEEVISQPRSISPTLVQKSAIENINKKVSQFDSIARSSVGLPVQ